MMSLQKDICHYQSILNLEEGIGVDSATMNIQVKQSKNERFHYYKESGFIAIYPFFSIDEEYSLGVMKGSHKAKKNGNNISLHHVVNEDKYPFVNIKIHKGQFILLHTKLLFAEYCCHEYNIIKQYNLSKIPIRLKLYYLVYYYL